MAGTVRPRYSGEMGGGPSVADVVGSAPLAPTPTGADVTASTSAGSPGAGRVGGLGAGAGTTATVDRVPRGTGPPVPCAPPRGAVAVLDIGGAVGEVGWADAAGAAGTDDDGRARGGRVGTAMEGLAMEGLADDRGGGTAGSGTADGRGSGVDSSVSTTSGTSGSIIFGAVAALTDGRLLGCGNSGGGSALAGSAPRAAPSATPSATAPSVVAPSAMAGRRPPAAAPPMCGFLPPGTSGYTFHRCLVALQFVDPRGIGMRQQWRTCWISV